MYYTYCLCFLTVMWCSHIIVGEPQRPDLDVRVFPQEAEPPGEHPPDGRGPGDPPRVLLPDEVSAGRCPGTVLKNGRRQPPPSGEDRRLAA